MDFWRPLWLSREREDYKLLRLRLQNSGRRMTP